MGFMKEFLSLEGGAPRFMRAGATTSFCPEKHGLAHVRRAYGCLQEEPDMIWKYLEFFKKDPCKSICVKIIG
jgi:hypothetical protein